MMALCGVVVGVVYDKIILPPLQCGGGVRLLSGPPNVIDMVEDSKLICGPLLLPLLTVVVLVAFYCRLGAVEIYYYCTFLRL